MKYAFIEDKKVYYSICRLCEVLKVSRSGYYSWKLRKPSLQLLRKQQLLSDIERIYVASHRSYGSPRIQAQLRSEHYTIGRTTVARYMQELKLQTQRAKRYKTVYAKRSEQVYRIPGNVLSRDFKAVGPNKKWVSDITFIRHQQGWMFLAVVIDLYSRAVVGWAMDSKSTQQLVSEALAMAVQSREPRPGLLLHSDQGSQYTSHAYLKQVKAYGMVLSMSRRGNCQDNAVAESFFHSLKIEWVRNRIYKKIEEAKQSIFKYIEMFYNRQRLHSTNGYKSPFVYEAANVA